MTEKKQTKKKHQSTNLLNFISLTWVKSLLEKPVKKFFFVRKDVISLSVNKYFTIFTLQENFMFSIQQFALSNLVDTFFVYQIKCNFEGIEC